MDLLAAIEAIGFDFALIGTIVTIVLVMCGHLLFRPAAPVDRTAITAFAFMRRRLRSGKVSELVLWSVLVSVVGMTFNVIADETFDKDDLPFVRSRDVDKQADTAVVKEQKVRLFRVPSCGRPDDEIQWPLLRWIKDEDAIKQDAIRDVCDRTGPNSPARAYIEPYTSSDGAKELAQIANAALWRTGSAASNTALRVEFLAVKMARVVALTATAVLIVTAARALAAIFQVLLFAIIALVGQAIKRKQRDSERAAVAVAPASEQATRSPFDAAGTLARQPEFRWSAAGMLGDSQAQRVTGWLWPPLKRTHENRLDVAYEWRQLRYLSVLFAAAIAMILLGVWMWELQSRRYYMKLFYVHLDAKQLETRPGPVVPRPLMAASFGAAGLPTIVAERSFIDADPKTGASGMYEFSGVTDFNGRVLVVDNETGRLRRSSETNDNALFFVSFGVRPDGGQVDVVRPPAGEFPPIEAWDDIEGLANDGEFVYGIGSHSLDDAGFVRPNRRVLLRLRPGSDDRAPTELKAYTGLYEALFALAAKLHLPDSAASASLGDRSVRVIRDLNIEGLEMAPATGPTKDLLLGLRSPLIAAGPDRSSRALVARLHDVDALFVGNSHAVLVTEEARLDLGGRGIAAIERDPRSDGYLIAAAPASETDPNDYSSLWLWRPADRQQTLRELIRFPRHKLEGIGRITWKDRPALLLAFDEEERSAEGGDDSARQFGRLAILEHDRF